MTEEEIKALQEKADKAAELEKQLAEKDKALEAERNEKKEIIAKRDAAKARQKELEDKLTLTESEKAELVKLVDAEKTKAADIENQTKAELLNGLDDSDKKIAEKLNLVDLREYVKLHGKTAGTHSGTKPKPAGNNEKPPKTYAEYKAQVANVKF